MAVDFDNAVATEGSGVSPPAVGITVANQPNRVLVLMTQNDNGDSVVSVTGGGGPNSWQLFDFEAPGRRQEIWYLIAPATGAQSIIATFVGAGPGSAHVISVYGADQVTPLINALKSGSGVTSQSGTNPAGNMWLSTLITNADPGTISVGTQNTAVNGFNIGRTARSLASPGVVTYPNGSTGRGMLGCSVVAAASGGGGFPQTYYSQQFNQAAR